MRQREAVALNYSDFIEGKHWTAPPTGMEVPLDQLSPVLYDFQAAITQRALSIGRYAIFADCGLGKTLMQLEWARFVGDVLIVAPLAVSYQTEREAVKLDMKISVCREQGEVRPGINITNYEMLHHFEPSFDGIVLDESSILKSYSGKYRQELTKFAATIPFRLACTATPSPNDITEIINHSEFLGILDGRQVLGTYFVQDGNTTHKWRLRGHAENAFWKWLASWSLAMRTPAELGYDDSLFVLPPLSVYEHTVDSPDIERDTLFPVEAHTLDDRRRARKASTKERVQRCAEIVGDSQEQWIVWCNLNEESRLMSQAIGAVEITGSDTREHKEKTMLGFSNGDVRRLVTKPRIAGFGMNWQTCHNVIFLGLSDSYEQYYQAMRRCWRFGQESPVDVHVVISEEEGAVRANISRKEQEAQKLFDGIISHVKDIQLVKEKLPATVDEDERRGDGYRILLGDSVKRIAEVEDKSVGLSIFSPPFPGMYVYTDSPLDIGNSRNLKELVEHFSYMAEPLRRITMPGRSCCIHLTQMVSFKWLDGFAGMRDFRGAVISMMEDAGWIYYGEVCIDKDPQVKAIRTKDQGLLFKTLATDSSKLHPALADYILQFKNPGDNLEPIRAGVSSKYGNPGGWITSEEWIEWAAPVWNRHTKSNPNGIKETDTLNVSCAREAEDEKHLCPLQLSVIERVVKLWSNPGDIVFSPFMGIGSEGYQALMLNRRFIGIELKRSYFDQAQRYLERALQERRTTTLFSDVATC